MTFKQFAPAGRVCAMLAASSAALVAASSAAHAQEASEILVEATLDNPASSSSGPEKALDETRINPPGSVSVTESLSLLPGVVAFEKGGAGSGSYVAIRGGEPNFALVTINGVRVDDPLNSSGGGFDFSLLEPALINRIAVISGPQSTIYGADALSGVIALDFGRARSGKSITTYSGIGSQGRYQLGGSIGIDGSAGELTVAGGFSDSDDFEGGSSSERYSAIVAASPDIGGSFSLDLFGLFAGSDSAGFPEDSGGPERAVLRDLEQRERAQIAFGGTLAARLSPGTVAQVRIGFAQSDFDSASPGIAPGVLDAVPPITTDSRFRRTEAIASLNHKAADWLTIEVGASLVGEKGSSTGTLDFGVLIPTDYSITRDMPGVFTTATIGLPNEAEISGGLRVDWPEGGSTRWTPRIGASFPIGQNGVAIFGNYSRGFKRPSLFALGFPLIANPDLEDERSEVFDAGLEFADADSGLAASATYFHSTYRNLIDFDPQLFTNVNRNRVTVEGVEAALSKQSGPVTARAALTYQSTSSDAGVQLRFRPNWTGRLSLRWQVARHLVVSAHGEFSSAFNDSSVPTGMVRNDGFETLALDAEWILSENITVFGAIRNVADAQFERTVGFPEPGRNLFIGLRTGF